MILELIRLNGECEPCGVFCHLLRRQITMRKTLITLALIVVLSGMMGTISPVDALPAETVWFFLENDGFENPKDGGIEIDLMNAHYATHKNVGEQNGKMYYELRAYNPGGIPSTISWGMTRADLKGNLHFSGIFDSLTLAWIESYGLAGATYSIRQIESF